jgi:hypothetical protein
VSEPALARTIVVKLAMTLDHSININQHIGLELPKRI